MTAAHQRIREILLRDWDPDDASRSDAASGAYDAYVGPLHDLLHSGAKESAVIDWLHEREQESMCFPSIGKERLRRVARLLIRAVRG